MRKRISHCISGLGRAILPAGLAVVLFFTASEAMSAPAEYRLDQGDVIELSLAGPLDVRQRSTIDANGELTITLLGTVKAAGLQLSELRTNLQRLLPEKTFRKRGPDGRENLAVLNPDEIGVEVVEYRPLYITGDVSKPGQQVFRPGMTVLQAVALAGGYEVVRLKMENPFLQMADLQSDYQNSWLEIARLQARALRIVAERDGETKVDFHPVFSMPLPNALLVEITSLEADQLRGSLMDYEKEKGSYERELQLTDRRINALISLQQEQERSVKDQEKELGRLHGLADKALLTAPRMVDAQRLLSLSAERVFQTAAELERSKKERETLVRQFQKMLEQRSIKFHSDLQDAKIRLANGRTRVQGIGEKLLYTGIVKSQMTAGTPPKITIVRKDEQGARSVDANESSELRPGDVVTVALQVGIIGSPPAERPVASNTGAVTQHVAAAKPSEDGR